jgi:hypothetical protein
MRQKRGRKSKDPTADASSYPSVTSFQTEAALEIISSTSKKQCIRPTTLDNPHHAVLSRDSSSQSSDSFYQCSDITLPDESMDLLFTSFLSDQPTDWFDFPSTTE